MISKLVIGGSPRLGEVSLLEGGHPRVLRSRIHDLHEARARCDVHTWSPLAIFEVTTRWIGDSEADWLERVYLRRSLAAPDVRIVDVWAPTWLAHFSLADLYIHGEFDDLLAASIDAGGLHAG